MGGSERELLTARLGITLTLIGMVFGLLFWHTSESATNIANLILGGLITYWFGPTSGGGGTTKITTQGGDVNAIGYENNGSTAVAAPNTGPER